MSNKKGNTNLKIAITTTAAAAIGGLMYYLGYEVAKEKHEEKHQQQNSQAGPSSSSEPLEECSICLKRMKPLRHLNCGHNFHDECISQWLPLSSTCPLCRATQQHD